MTKQRQLSPVLPAWLEDLMRVVRALHDVIVQENALLVAASRNSDQLHAIAQEKARLVAQYAARLKSSTPDQWRALSFPQQAEMRTLGEKLASSVEANRTALTGAIGALNRFTQTFFSLVRNTHRQETGYAALNHNNGHRHEAPDLVPSLAFQRII